jgi:hypothetical protein
MIQLDTRNGHDFGVVTHFNRVSSTLSDRDILEVILNRWADDHDIDEISDLLIDLQFHDFDGNPLCVGDIVVVLDDTELVENPPKRGDVLKVTALIDQESNYIGCGNHGLFAHRLLKVKKSF